MDYPLPAEERMAEAVAAYPAQVLSLMLEILTLPDAERARRIGELYADEQSRSFAEVLIDLEEDPAARAFVVGMLREMDRGNALGPSSSRMSRMCRTRTITCSPHPR